MTPAAGDKTLLSFEAGRDLYKALKNFAKVVDGLHPELVALQRAMEAANANFSIDFAMSDTTFFKIVDYLMSHVEKFLSPSELTILAALENSGLSPETMYLFARRYIAKSDMLSRSILREVGEENSEDVETFRNILARVPFLGRDFVVTFLGTKFGTMDDVIAMISSHVEHNNRAIAGDFIYAPANYLPDLLLSYTTLKLVLEQVNWQAPKSKVAFNAIFGTDVFDGSPMFVGLVEPLIDEDEGRDDLVGEIEKSVAETTHQGSMFEPPLGKPSSSKGYVPPTSRYEDDDYDFYDPYDPYDSLPGGRNPHGTRAYNTTSYTPPRSSYSSASSVKYASPIDKPISYTQNGFPILNKEIERLSGPWHRNRYYR